MDAFIYSVCGEDFDLMESLKNNAFANVFTALFGEPVDAVTGAYLLTATDLVLPGIAEDFALKREYRSARHKCGLFGKGWQTRWESRLSHDGRQMHLTAATGHTMCFSLEGDVWVNQTPGCGRFSLEADVPAGIWRLYDGAEHRTYTYSREGFLLSETDQNGGKTVLSYTDRVLSEIRTALGAQVSLETEGGRITGAADGLVREYAYDESGNLVLEKDSSGREKRYTYDTRHNRTCTREKLSPGNWRVLSWEYDSLGRLLLETDAKKRQEYQRQMEQESICLPQISFSRRRQFVTHKETVGLNVNFVAKLQRNRNFGVMVV